MSNVVIDPYTPYAVSDELWNQTEYNLDAGYNDYVESGCVSPDTDSSFVGKTLRSFSIVLKSVDTKGNSPFKAGVWAADNVSRTPDTEFTGDISNMNEITTSYVTYTFTNETGHPLEALDNIGFVFASSQNNNWFKQQTSGSGSAPITGLSATIWVNTTPVTWGYRSSTDLMVGIASSAV